MKRPRLFVVLLVASAVSSSPDASAQDQAATAQPADQTPSKAFLNRLFEAYADDWKGTESSGPAPKFRGDPAPLSNPPYPFNVWPYGGAPVIGQPDTNVPPLMQAIYGGSSGKAWEKSRLKIYGWLNFGGNVSTSDQTHGTYSNSPAAYSVIPNAVQLDQGTVYIERVPDTVQTDHWDWGFRLTNLYGLDYRFTTAKGYFSGQLLGHTNPDGSLGNKYGYDPVMMYVDLYDPHVADGLNIRIGRYISLPDIEAQLAPNNYMYSHSLTYTYDCYTQTGVNATLQMNRRVMLQGGVSAGCEAAPWAADAKLTFNWCVGLTWREGWDNVYMCDNALNDGNYAYNNLQAVYATWYHKFNDKWHTATEYWYQWENKVPNLTNPDPAAASLLETGANGAFCQSATSLVCHAPNTAMVNYLNRQFSKRDYFSIRNEFFDDMVGQRTGTKSRYTEHAVSYNRWIGSTLLFRPEIRYDIAYDAPAYDGGTGKHQFMVAADFLIFY